MSRYAAVDCGTNAIRLLISEINEYETREIVRRMTVIRLGEGVDATGQIDPKAIQRARVALSEFATIMRNEHVQAVRMVATSATRDASNKQEFFDMTAEVLGTVIPGVQAEVITGEEEARLSFQGAIADMDPEQGPFCVIDLGGGSTEFVLGTDAQVSQAYSAQMGCVRISERFLHTDPMAGGERDAAEYFVRKELAKVSQAVDISKARSVIGCAGTFTTIAALGLGLERYDATAIHDSVFDLAGLHVICEDLISQTVVQRSQLPVMHPGRADVIGGGALVVQGIISLLQQKTKLRQIIVSEKDILDGIVAELAAQGSKESADS
ncbi:MAG: Ppx/GppA phosphatase family protein [Corynebacterium sp.]|nr:Ppx/GppA phosphatase family protein [Corynebacterium sp.]